MLLLTLILFMAFLIVNGLLPAATPVTRAGVLVSGALATPAAASQTFSNSGKEFLLIQNGSIAQITATFVTQEAVNDGAADLTVQDPTATIAAGATRLFGPFKPSVFNGPTRLVTVTLSAFADVTVTVLSAVPFAPQD